MNNELDSFWGWQRNGDSHSLTVAPATHGAHEEHALQAGHHHTTWRMASLSVDDDMYDATCAQSEGAQIPRDATVCGVYVCGVNVCGVCVCVCRWGV